MNQTIQMTFTVSCLILWYLNSGVSYFSWKCCLQSKWNISGTSGDIDMGSLGECLESNNWQAFYCYLNSILFSLHVKWYADMMSSYWNISTKPTAQSFHFDCKWLRMVPHIWITQIEFAWFESQMCTNKETIKLHPSFRSSGVFPKLNCS